MAKKITKRLKLVIPAGKANPAPPVGPALGQAGINIGDFVKKFNDATASMIGDIVPVEIIVMEYIHGCTFKSLGTVNAITPLHLDVEKYITNLTDAVNWMNTETGVLHRDMHLKNIMVDFYTHKPVIIDFGRAILQSEISKDVNPYEFFDQRTYIVRHHKSDSQALQEAINYLRFFKKIIR